MPIAGDSQQFDSPLILVVEAQMGAILTRRNATLVLFIPEPGELQCVTQESSVDTQLTDDPPRKTMLPIDDKLKSAS